MTGIGSVDGSNPDFSFSSSAFSVGFSDSFFLPFVFAFFAFFPFFSTLVEAISFTGKASTACFTSFLSDDGWLKTDYLRAFLALSFALSFTSASAYSISAWRRFSSSACLSNSSFSAILLLCSSMSLFRRVICPGSTLLSVFKVTLILKCSFRMTT